MQQGRVGRRNRLCGTVRLQLSDDIIVLLRYESNRRMVAETRVILSCRFQRSSSVYHRDVTVLYISGD